MSDTVRTTVLFALMGALIVATGFMQSWNSALFILNFGLISAVMALGVNMQWGFAGLFNVGIMGFVALGALATVLVSQPPVGEAWAAGGVQILLGLVLGAAAVVAAILVYARMPKGRMRGLAVAVVVLVGFMIFRAVYDPAVQRVEAVDPSLTGYLGGMNLPIILSWPVGGLLAAGAAWVIGKTALGLRSDYLAIATLGISEIIIAIMKNEDWLTRGVKNVTGLDRPVPYEIDLQQSAQFVERAQSLGIDPVEASGLWVKLMYGLLFAAVLIVIYVALQLALKSPWGRMVRAIRDNETAARAMGKDVTRQHLQIFVLGSAICGIAGAMAATLDGQLVPTGYQPLRFTFLIWVMVIVGGSGSNTGAMLGGFLVGFLWLQVDTLGAQFMGLVTSGLADGSELKAGLEESVAYMRLLTMGLIMLLVLRFSPRGLIPEK